MNRLDQFLAYAVLNDQANDDGSYVPFPRFVDMRKRRSQLTAGGLPAHLRHAA